MTFPVSISGRVRLGEPPDRAMDQLETLLTDKGLVPRRLSNNRLSFEGSASTPGSLGSLGAGEIRIVGSAKGDVVHYRASFHRTAAKATAFSLVTTLLWGAMKFTVGPSPDIA